MEGSSRTGDGVHGRKLHIRRKACSMDLRNSSMGLSSPEAMSPTMSDMESPQIKASRDVRCPPLLLPFRRWICDCAL